MDDCQSPPKWAKMLESELVSGDFMNNPGYLTKIVFIVFIALVGAACQRITKEATGAKAPENSPPYSVKLQLNTSPANSQGAPATQQK